MSSHEPAICGEVTCRATISQVWDAWTTETGITSFFAPACHIDFRVGGDYEILFDPSAPPGQRGAEGVRLLAIQKHKMISFTWNAPPHLTTIRDQWTHVTIRFFEISPERTMVTLHHDGWGDGGEWDEAFQYFTRAWLQIVLPRLAYRFRVGPVDWNNPPKLSSDIPEQS